MDDASPAPAATRSRGRTAATLLVGIALGATAVLLGGWIDRTPADPHDAPAFNGAALSNARKSVTRLFPRPPGEFRLVTWNVHGFAGPDGAEELADGMKAVRSVGFDLAALQEVAALDEFEMLDPPDELAWLSHADAAFIETERRFGVEHTGNAVLSKLPAGPVHRIPLPDTRGKAFRTVVLTTVFVPTEANPDGEAVRVLNVHLTKPNLEPGQIERAIDLFLALETPCVLAGDFNQPIDAPALAGLLAVDGVTDALAALDPDVVLASLPVGKEKVDHIFVRGLTVGEAAVVPTKASDHPLYRVDLSLPPAVSPLP